MPDPTPPAAPAGPEELGLVLFGLPAAGKSSLLGALGEAAQTQEHLLGGKLIDRTGGLEELRHRLYEASPRRTAEEVVPYPVRYEPFAGEGRPSEPPTDAVLMDCDGRVANDLLLRRQTLEENSPEGSLAREVIEAETLILVVDASAPPSHLDADFVEFGRFLRTMEQGRGERVEVGGLPVFLVLTKCDLLAQPTDSAAGWMDRIEQRKREVDGRFRAFLETPGQGRPEGGFGWLDLHVWATAVKRPALAGAPARPREPYGVAELFRQCFAAADTFRNRARRSTRRLAGTVIASVILVLSMVGLTAGLFAFGLGGRASLLQQRVEDFRFLDRGGPAERLRGSPERLREKLTRLESMRDDPQFERLPAELRTFVEDRLEELQTYLRYYEMLLALPPLANERTEEGLQQRLTRLRDEQAPPRPGWEKTEAGRLHERLLNDAEALRKAVQTARNWYLDSSDAAGKLWTFASYKRGPEGPGIDWADWTTQVEKLIDPGRRPPFQEADPVMSLALRFDRVVDARAAWEADRARLRRLLDVCSALGLATTTEARPAVLVFPRDFTLAQAKPRVEELRKAYPEYRTTFVRGVLPDAVAPIVAQAARNQYRLLLEPGRAEVLKQLRLAGKGTEETLARWDAVRDWLRRDPEELSGWRILAEVLLRLHEPTAEEPVAALATFLNRRQFTVEARTLVLEVPETLRLSPRAEARLVVLHPASGRQPALAFESSGEPRRDPGRRVRSYTFRLAEGIRLAYKPGDKLWAELPLSGGTERLIWSNSRSGMYQFERLRNPPRQQAAGAKSLTDGRLLDEVQLIIVPDEGVPRVPDLMPMVRLGE